MLPVFLLTYGAVFAAELVGDKLLYTAAVLAARYRAMSIVCGATLAWMVKIGAAVLMGGAVSRMPRLAVAALTTGSFFWVAYRLWRNPRNPRDDLAPRQPSGGALPSFALVLCSEWADLGQITTATMVARFGSPGAVWLGAVCAMTTKGILAVWFGAGVRRWLRDRLSPQMLRFGSATLLLLLGGLAVAESVLGGQ